MNRNAIQDLITWKASEDRKPMVLKGARQVGKTWLMKEFGQNCYDSFVYFTFDEFLCAVDPALYDYYVSIQKNQQIEDIFHNRLLESYNYYLIIGGMPECVDSWIKYRDHIKISRIQHELIEVYENDFSKHNGKINSGRILMVFRSIVAQLAKPNEKFMHGAVREGGRAREFEEAVEWLVSAGMLNRVFNISKMEHPLSAAILLKTDYQFKEPLTENYCLQQFRGQFEIGPATSLTKIMKLTLCCNMGLRLSPLK